MRKLIVIMSVVLIVLAGCTTTTDSSGPYLTFSNGNSIHMGMTKAEVDEQLDEAGVSYTGEAIDEENPSGMYFYGEDIMIGYSEGDILLIIGIEEGMSTGEGVTIGDSRESVKDTYTSFEYEEDEESITVSMAYEDEIYLLIFYFDAEEYVASIGMGYV